MNAAQLRLRAALPAVDNTTHARLTIPADNTVTLASTRLRGVVQVIWRDRLVNVFASDLRRHAEIVDT